MAMAWKCAVAFFAGYGFTVWVGLRYLRLRRFLHKRSLTPRPDSDGSAG